MRGLDTASMHPSLRASGRSTKSQKPLIEKQSGSSKQEDSFDQESHSIMIWWNKHLWIISGYPAYYTIETFHRLYLKSQSRLRWFPCSINLCGSCWSGDGQTVWKHFWSEFWSCSFRYYISLEYFLRGVRCGSLKGVLKCHYIYFCSKREFHPFSSYLTWNSQNLISNYAWWRQWKYLRLT